MCFDLIERKCLDKVILIFRKQNLSEISLCRKFEILAVLFWFWPILKCLDFPQNRNSEFQPTWCTRSLCSFTPVNTWRAYEVLSLPNLINFPLNVFQLAQLFWDSSALWPAYRFTLQKWLRERGKDRLSAVLTSAGQDGVFQKWFWLKSDKADVILTGLMCSLSQAPPLLPPRYIRRFRACQQARDPYGFSCSLILIWQLSLNLPFITCQKVLKAFHSHTNSEL